MLCPGMENAPPHVGNMSVELGPSPSPRRVRRSPPPPPRKGVRLPPMASTTNSRRRHVAVAEDAVQRPRVVCCGGVRTGRVAAVVVVVPVAAQEMRHAPVAPRVRRAVRRMWHVRCPQASV